MTQMPEQPKPFVSRRKEPSLSALAVVALVIACIPCCPFVNLLGAMLGVAALRRIRASQGRLGGKRVATVAVAIGLGLAVLLSAAWLTFSYREQQRLDAQMTSQALHFVQAAQDDQPDKAIAAWRASSRSRLTGDDIRNFGAQALSRFGRLNRITIASHSNSGSMFSPTIEAACVFVFESSQRTGSAGFQLSVTSKSIWPELRLIRLHIDDAENGPLTIPNETR